MAVNERILSSVGGVNPTGNIRALVVGAATQGDLGGVRLVGNDSDLENIFGAGPLVDSLKDIGLGVLGSSDPILGGMRIASNAYTGLTDFRKTNADDTEGFETPRGITITGIAVDSDPIITSRLIYKFEVTGIFGDEVVFTVNHTGDTNGENANFRLDTSIGHSALPENAGIFLRSVDTSDFAIGDFFHLETFLTGLGRHRVGGLTTSANADNVAFSVVADTDGISRDADIIVRITTAGGRGVGRFKLSYNVGNVETPPIIIPKDGVYELGNTNLQATFSDVDFAVGEIFAINCFAPVVSVLNVVNSVERYLRNNKQMPEFLLLAGVSKTTGWNALQILSQNLFNLHKPIICIAGTDVPYHKAAVPSWAARLNRSVENLTARNVSVVSAYGGLLRGNGARYRVNIAGLLLGRLLSVDFATHVGRVSDGNITSSLNGDEEYFNHRLDLNSAGFITQIQLLGKEGRYWDSDFTFDVNDSIYKSIRVLRIANESLKLARVVALDSVRSSLGDVGNLGDNSAGIETLKARIRESILNGLGNNITDAVVSIPKGQNFAETGNIIINFTVITPAVFNNITLQTKVVLAGTNADPRV